MIFYLYGFIVMAHEGLQERIQKMRWISLGSAVLCFIVLFAIWAGKGDPIFGTPRYTQIFGIFGLSSWFWLLTFFGFGMKHLNYLTDFLAYANEAVLPFSILHQTVLLCVGYFVVRGDSPDPLKFLVIGSSSFVVVVALYEYLVKRVNLLRVLFGMKPKAKSQAMERDVAPVSAKA